MNNALWLCLQTNRLAFYQEPTARFFELAFRPANTNVCQKRKKKTTHSFFIIHLPLWTVRLKHTSKCRRALFFNFILVFFFFTCNSPHHAYYLWSPGLSSIHECIQSTQHIRLRLGCFWLRSVSWHPVWSEVPSSLLISAERSPIHPSIWRIACGTF